MIGQAMFDAFCPHCHQRLLLGPTSILDLRSVEGGSLLVFRCPCGGTGAEFIANRRKGETPVAAASGAA